MWQTGVIQQNGNFDERCNQLHKMCMRKRRDLGGQFPGHLDSFALEVVSKAEVPEHLEERVVASSDADVLNVVRTDTLLRRGRTWYGPRGLSQEYRLELKHASDCKEHCRVVRDKG